MIKLEHISKTFGDTGDGVHAVKDVSLEIGDGEIFGIIGFSGAGKSTLVRCINLLEQPTSGSITVNGQKLTLMEKQADGKSCMRTVSPQELRQARKKISMIFQGFNLLMQRTCLKNVCFPMELSGVPKAQAEKKALELLDLVGLKENVIIGKLIPAGAGLGAYRHFAEELVPEKEEPAHEVQIISNAVAAAHTED